MKGLGHHGKTGVCQGLLFLLVPQGGTGCLQVFLLCFQGLTGRCQTSRQRLPWFLPEECHTLGGQSFLGCQVTGPDLPCIVAGLAGSIFGLFCGGALAV